MGQARKRGTYEQRKSAAIARNEAMQKESDRLLNPRNLIRQRPKGEDQDAAREAASP